jgi:hypothetical protein
MRGHDSQHRALNESVRPISRTSASAQKVSQMHSAASCLFLCSTMGAAVSTLRRRGEMAISFSFAVMNHESIGLSEAFGKSGY